jgi:phage/conjugal plasmid C-4 type zinc finger TraR family protein
MTDIYDRATEHEEQMREDALSAQARRAGLTGKTWRDSADECRLCGAGIPMKRRRAMPGVQTCIECQTELEMAARHG